jgi:hypothetical protein
VSAIPEVPVTVLLLASIGCKPTEEANDVAVGLPVLGAGSHDLTGVLEVVGDRQDGLSQPQDLAFDPAQEGLLWVVNRRDDSVVLFHDAGTAEQRSEHLIDPYALHFMDSVSSIAMGPNGYFGTCQDSRNTYNDSGAENTFMGPTLWSSDLDVFATSNPEAVEALSDLFGMPVDLGSHLDMLHESPNCMGMAWESDNVYWVFDGFNRSIVRYDFQQDHGVGWDDHSDGIIERWVDNEVKRKAGTVSHLELDRDSGLLYIADTGNNRVAVLDTNTGRRGDDLPSTEPGTDHYTWNGGDLTTLVEGVALGMSAPSGLALIDDTLFVTDAGTGRIHAFDLAGNELDWAETGREGGLAGVIAVSSDELWLVDKDANEVLRLRP